MDTLESTPVMQWEMYGSGSAIQFWGVRDANGYGLMVMRDETTVLRAGVEDAATLLRRSSELREQLQQLGYTVRPLATRAAQLPGGPCWGPGTPLDTALLCSVR